MNTDCGPQRSSVRFMLLSGIIIGLLGMLFSFSMGIKIMVTVGIAILIILICECITKKSKPDEEITITLAELKSPPTRISHYKMNFCTPHAILECILDENYILSKESEMHVFIPCNELTMIEQSLLEEDLKKLETFSATLHLIIIITPENLKRYVHPVTMEYIDPE